jgi:uncharacterized membrane protein
MQQPRRVDVRWEWISQGWEMYSKQMGNWLVISLIVFLISVIPIGPFYAFMIASLGIGSNSDPQDVLRAIQASGVNILATLIMSVMTALIQAFSYSGYYHVAMKQLRGEQFSVGDFFGGMKNLVPMLGVTGILAAIQFVGNLLCCLGSLVTLLTLGLLMFSYPLIVDRNLGTIEAIKASLDVTKQNAPMFILFGIVVHLVGGIGIVVCCIGVIFTAPLLITSVSCAYRDCFGSPGSFDAYAPPPPPSYGGYDPPPPPPSSWQ